MSVMVKLTMFESIKTVHRRGLEVNGASAAVPEGGCGGGHAIDHAIDIGKPPPHFVGCCPTYYAIIGNVQYRQKIRQFAEPRSSADPTPADDRRLPEDLFLLE